MSRSGSVRTRRCSYVIAATSHVPCLTRFLIGCRGYGRAAARSRTYAACAPLQFQALGWTYEFVEYNNNIGYVLENGTAVGEIHLQGGGGDWLRRKRSQRERPVWSPAKISIDCRIRRLTSVKNPY